MQLEYTSIPEWPPLAWLAILRPGHQKVEVLHGPWVETRVDWFCEAAWDGDFDSGDFDRTDIVAGTGARLREKHVRFVSAGSNLDRLHSFRTSGETIVSNSYCCLLASLGATADLRFREYNDRLRTYRYAFFGEYKRSIPSSAGEVRLTYFADLIWDAETLQEIEKPGGDRRFEHFTDYSSFLRGAMVGIVSNAKDPRRKQSFSPICPISKGYDSPAVALLAKDSGPITTFTFPRDRNGKDDSGAAIAELLTLTCHVVDRDTWRKETLPEVPFLAGSLGVGDISFTSASPLLRGSLLLNGVGGVPVWDKDTILNEGLAVGDGALFGLVEYRLWEGFLNASVPCWGIRQLSDIVRITNSEEMRAWDVGGNYNKPICRRLLEESGVPRGFFATGKSGVSHAPEARRDYLLPESRRDFLNWLHSAKSRARRQGIVVPNPTLGRIIDAVLAPLSRGIGTILNSEAKHGLARMRFIRAPLSALRRRLRQPYYHYRMLFHWAVDHMIDRYGRSGLEYRERRNAAIRENNAFKKAGDPLP